tara:strand:- start:788 stop:1588 length:801 start_codon:yes stop_codon:yes gene_type:complete
MNSLEKKMCDILKRCVEHYGVDGTKAEFEAEGTRTDELLRLLEIANKSGAKIGLKIGGCEAIKDLYESKQLGVNYIIAPMVETPYALKKFINAKKLVYSDEEALDTNFLFNCESITAFKNIDELANVCINNKDDIDGIVFGRVDFSGSLGLKREEIEEDLVTDAVLKVSEKCKNIGIDYVVGGAVSFDARENLKKFKSVHLSRFETRKIIFNSNALELNNLEKALKDAVHFELLWLFNKREYYAGIYKEDDKRIKMLEDRWNVLES